MATQLIFLQESSLAILLNQNFAPGLMCGFLKNERIFMNGLPLNIDLSFFIGSEVSSISFGEHILIFSFQAQNQKDIISMTIESSVTLMLSDGQQYRWEDFREGGSYLVKLIGDTVTKVESNVNGTLKIYFQSANMLEIYDDSKHYESYQIKYADKIIVV